MIAFNMVFYIATIFAGVFACDNKNLGTCSKRKVVYLASAAVNCLSHLLILLLPQLKVWELRMKLARKIGVAIIFTVGSL
jgi:hypothetical protein